MAKWHKAAAIGGGIVAALGIASALLVRREARVEQPDFTTVETDGPIEIRDYAEQIVAETTEQGDRIESMRRGFHRLAGYIFAKHRGGAGDHADDTPIAMTAPVLADRANGGRWRTRFVMPAQFTRDTLPRPGRGVTIAELPARRIAAIRFAGNGGDDALNAHERDLRLWLAKHQYRPVGPAEFAFYNSPMIPPPLRRNEVLIPIAR